MKISFVIIFSTFFTILFSREDFYPVLFQNNINNVDSIRITCGWHDLKDRNGCGRFEMDEFPFDTIAINTVKKSIEDWKQGYELEYKWEIRYAMTISASKLQEFKTAINNTTTTKKGILTKLITDSHTYRFYSDQEGKYTKASILLHHYYIEWCTTPKRYSVEYHYNNSGRIDQIRTIMDQIGWSRNYQMIVEYYE